MDAGEGGGGGGGWEGKSSEQLLCCSPERAAPLQASGAALHPEVLKYYQRSG